MKKIETGVDKLIRLIEEKKKITVTAAAKQLGVSSVLVQEWADFLEEDKLISIEYSLSKVWLMQRKLSEKEIEKRTKDYTRKKDVFIRKVETTLKSLENETQGFEKMKTEFENLRKQIGGEIDFVKKELDELKHYENLKQNIDKDIELQKKEYQKMITKSQAQIRTEEMHYKNLIAQVETEKKKVNKEKNRIKSLEQRESELESQLKEMKSLIYEIKKEIKTENKSLAVSKSNMEKLEQYVEQVGTKVKVKKHKSIIPLLKMSEEHKSKVINLQNDILEKLKEKKKSIKEISGQQKKVYKNLDTFFKKKAKTDTLFHQIDKDRLSLDHEYEALITKAEGFKAITRDANAQKHLQELEESFKKIDQNKSKLLGKIHSLRKMITG